MGKVFAYLLENEPRKAEPVAKQLADGDDPFFRFIGRYLRSICLLHQGRSVEALSSAEEASRVSAGTFSARAHIVAANLLLERGEPEKALRQAEEARSKGRGNYGEWAGLFYAALAEERRGRTSEADRFAEELRKYAEALPTEKENRRYHHLRGELLLSRGDAPGALVELEKAAATLPAEGSGGPTNVPQHVPVWFSLASAYLAVGDEAHAEECFEKIRSARIERMMWAIPYVRSFYHLAKIHEKRGDTAGAKEHYRQFFELWKDGDLDRDKVEEARRALGS
jgi:tetratricopeptide (TPR) repeat protein